MLYTWSEVGRLLLHFITEMNIKYRSDSRYDDFGKTIMT
jgi:hypothetical protein